MEYTKDVILNIIYKDKFNSNKLAKFANKLKQIILKNKIISITLVLLTSLIIIDIMLVNYFFQILSNIY